MAYTSPFGNALTELFSTIQRKPGSLATVNGVNVASATYQGNGQVGIEADGKRIASFSFGCAPVANYVYSEADTAADRDDQAADLVKKANEMAAKLSATAGSFELAPQGDNTTNVKLSEANVVASALNGYVTVHVKGLLDSGNIGGDSTKFTAAMGPGAGS